MTRPSRFCFAVLVAVPALLTGCGSEVRDRYEKLVAESAPAVVISGGTRVLSNGAILVVWGDDLCPDNEGSMRALFGPSPDAGARNCILVPKDAASVSVHLSSPKKGIVTERWTIRREGPGALRTFFARPDGSPILAAVQ